MSECRKEGKKIKNKGDIFFLAKSFTCVALTVSRLPVCLGGLSKVKLKYLIPPPQMVKKENSDTLFKHNKADPVRTSGHQSLISRLVREDLQNLPERA